MIHVMYFDLNKVSADEACQVHEQISDFFSKNGDIVLTMPLGLSWIQDYPLTELKNFRDYLTAIIERTEVRQINDL